MDPSRPSSPEWAALSASTKKTWGSALDRIEEKWGDTPLAVWNDPRMVAKVVAWRDSRAGTPRSADIGVMVLRALLEFGRLRGRVTLNAAAKIPQLYRNGQRAEIVWTDDDIDRFTQKAEELGQTHIGEFAIVKKALKRSAGKRRHMSMPKIPALDALLHELRTRMRRDGVETVLVNSQGMPWSGDGFGGSFNRIRDAANIVHVDDDSGEQTRKHLHDVRGTFCTKLLAETPLSDREVADIMGWSPERVSAVRRIYVDQAKIIVALGERLRSLR